AAGGSAELCVRILAANNAAEAFLLARTEGIALGDEVARAAKVTAERVVAGGGIAIEIALFDRDGTLVGRAPFDFVESFPSPAWGGWRGGGREVVCGQRRVRVRPSRCARRLPTPLPTLPLTGGGMIASPPHAAPPRKRRQ